LDAMKSCNSDVAECSSKKVVDFQWILIVSLTALCG
jgi:hypothetical protein